MTRPAGEAPECCAAPCQGPAAQTRLEDKVRSWTRWLLMAALAVSSPAAAASPTGQGVHYVYLIRHGDYARDRNIDDRLGNGLDSLGHEQARMIGARLAALPVKIATLTSSDFTRARETADAIALALHMTAARDSLIHECSPNSDRADTTNVHRREAIRLCESHLVAAWEKYFQPTPATDTHEVLVCHANVIRWMVARALGVDTKRWSAMEIGNASLTVIAVLPDGATKLVMFSDVGHLQAEKQTWTGKGAGWTMGPAR